MRQTTFAQGSFERYAKTTKRAVFLSEMNQVLPWSMLCELVEPLLQEVNAKVTDAISKIVCSSASRPVAKSDDPTL